MTWLTNNTPGAPRTFEDDFDSQFGRGPTGAIGVGETMPWNGTVAPVGEVSGGNFLQRLLGGGGTSPGGTGQKRSFLDTIGGLADVIANVGGANPLYSMGQDRQQAQQQMKLENDWKQKFNTQKLTKGENELQDDVLARMGQATRGLSAVFQQSGPAGVQKAWPILAQQLGVAPEKAQEMARMLADDPEGTLVMLNSALAESSNTGSQPKEIQLYNMLLGKDPALAEEYINAVATGEKGMTEYQRASLGQRGEGLDFRRSDANRNFRLRQQAADRADRKAAGSEGAPKNSATFRDVIGRLRKNYDALKADGGMVSPNAKTGQNIQARVRASGLGQLVEGAVGTKSQTYRDNITTSRPAIVQAIKEATGMSAKQLDSNADMKLALSQATDPTQSYETNMEALSRLEALVAAQSGGGSPAGPRRPASRRPRGNAGKVGTKPSVSNW